MSSRICPDCEKFTDLLTCPDCGTGTLEHSPFAKRVDPLLGKLIAGRYRIDEVLGVGGMARVYVAEQIAMKRQVALKVIRSLDSGELSQKIGLFKRFQREAMAASRLEHPNTVRVYDFGVTEDGLLFLAMELLRGRTLTKVMSEGPMSPRRVAHIAVQLCRSLANAHEHGVVHRDLKPENVMVSDLTGQDDFVKVLDFGIAKISSATGESSITRTGLVMGTPCYMAPEQATGGKVGPVTDMYALGVILFEALSGRAPFSGETPLAVLMKHMNEPPPPLVVDGIPPDVPLDMVDIVNDLLQKNPSSRPDSALAVAKRLEGIRFDRIAQSTAVTVDQAIDQETSRLVRDVGDESTEIIMPPKGLDGGPQEAVSERVEVSHAEPLSRTEDMFKDSGASSSEQSASDSKVSPSEEEIRSDFASFLPPATSDDSTTEDVGLVIHGYRRKKFARTFFAVLSVIVAAVAVWLALSIGDGNSVETTGKDELPAVVPVKAPRLNKNPFEMVIGTAVGLQNRLASTRIELPSAVSQSIAAKPGEGKSAESSGTSASNPKREPSGQKRGSEKIDRPAKKTSEPRSEPPSKKIKEESRAADDVVREKPKPAFPSCQSDACPIKGYCIDSNGNRVNGVDYCGDIAF